MSELKEELKQIGEAVQQVWELTAYIEKVANELYKEDMTTLNTWAMTLLGAKELINQESVFALKKIKELENKDK